MLENIHWLGHASFKIMREDKVIYVDPYELREDEPAADLIFVTHEHFDHMSVDDIQKIQGPGTIIVTTEACARKLSGYVRVVKAGERLTVAGGWSGMITDLAAANYSDSVSIRSGTGSVGMI